MCKPSNVAAAATANQLSTSILPEATNEHLAEPDYFCGCCYQYFTTEEQYYAHKSECAEEYGMRLMAQEHYEDEDGWRDYEYEQEDDRMEDFRQNAISEAVCRRCQRYFHVCKCN